MYFTCPRFLRCFFVVLILPVVLANAFAAEKAKNVIIMIGDGMGFNSDLAGSYYRYGDAYQQRYHAFPTRLACTTFAQAGKDQSISGADKGYDTELIWSGLVGMIQRTEHAVTTDSAAASTAIHGGKKTLNGRIGVDADGNDIELVSEFAKKLGKKIGSVTTVQMSHATPAGFAAHDKSRVKYDELTNQMIAETSPLSVVFGCGHPLYRQGRKIDIIDSTKEEMTEEELAKIAQQYQFVGGEQTWQQMQTGSVNGFTVIETREQFDELAAAKESNKAMPEKVIGVVRSYDWVPPVDAVLDDLPETRKIRDAAFPKVEWNELPSLATMTTAALNVLAQNNDNGFMLMVEGGAIDWANHGQQMDRSVCEHLGFTKAIDAAIDWVEKHSSWDETLIIVTADHETGLIWPENTYEDTNGNKVFDKGEPFFGFRPLTQSDRGTLPVVQYCTTGHSNLLVPLWAKGAGAGLFLQKIRGRDEKAAGIWNFSGDYIDNTDVADVIRNAIRP